MELNLYCCNELQIHFGLLSKKKRKETLEMVYFVQYGFFLTFYFNSNSNNWIDRQFSNKFLFQYTISTLYKISVLYFILLFLIPQYRSYSPNSVQYGSCPAWFLSDLHERPWILFWKTIIILLFFRTLARLSHIKIDCERASFGERQTRQ